MGCRSYKIQGKSKRKYTFLSMEMPSCGIRRCHDPSFRHHQGASYDVQAEKLHSQALLRSREGTGHSFRTSLYHEEKDLNGKSLNQWKETELGSTSIRKKLWCSSTIANR